MRLTKTRGDGAGHLAVPIYDLRFTIYDLRFTIWRIRAQSAEKRSGSAAEFLEQGEKPIRKVPEEPSDGGGGGVPPPIYDFRWTIYDLDVRALARGMCGAVVKVEGGGMGW